MIRLVSGNLFDCQVGALVNTVNCVGVMGAGVAMQYKMRYPEMFQDYVRRCRSGLVKPGQPYMWRSEESLFGSDSRIGSSSTSRRKMIGAIRPSIPTLSPACNG